MEWDDDERSVRGFVFKEYANDDTYVSTKDQNISTCLKQMYDEQKREAIVQTSEQYLEEVAKRLAPELNLEEDEVKEEKEEQGEEFNSVLLDNEIYRKFAYS